MNKDGFCDTCIFFDGENCKGAESSVDENGISVCNKYPGAVWIRGCPIHKEPKLQPTASLWIPVSDQEPPKNGKWFITIDMYNQPNIHDFIGGQWRDLADNRYPENKPPFVKWMEKPE